MTKFFNHLKKPYFRGKIFFKVIQSCHAKLLMGFGSHAKLRKTNDLAPIKCLARGENKSENRQTKGCFELPPRTQKIKLEMFTHAYLETMHVSRVPKLLWNIHWYYCQLLVTNKTYRKKFSHAQKQRNLWLQLCNYLVTLCFKT